MNEDRLAKFYSMEDKLPEVALNEYIIIQDAASGSLLGPYKKKSYGFDSCEFRTLESEYIGNIKPKNKDPYQIAFIDSLYTNQVTFCIGKPGSGKAIPNEAIIPTPSGSKKVKDIRMEDFLFNENGMPTKVLGVFPQGKQKIWEVHFADGKIAKCSGDHLWTVKNPKGKLVTRTTKELSEYKLNLGTETKAKYGYRIPVSAPIEYEEKQFSVDPYLMGAFLGDGCMTEKTLTFSSADEELVTTIQNILGSKRVKRSHPTNYNWHFSLEGSKYSYIKKRDQARIFTENVFEKFPELIGADSYHKFIPEEYFYGSIEQRYALLQGLLDTDGSIDKTKGRISFTSVSLRLIQDVIRLCNSLQIVVKGIHEDHRDKYKEGVCYDINLTMAPKNKRKCFRLSRKRKIAEQFDGDGASYMYKWNSIVKIEETLEETEMTCFYVDNPNHLFLMNDYIVTHNTQISLGYAFQELERGHINKIYMFVNPMSARGAARLGFLPGDLNEKLLGCQIGNILSTKLGDMFIAEQLINNGQLVIVPMSNSRGIDIPKGSLVYSTESQNLDVYLMKLLLQRIPDDVKVIIEGDIRQTDDDAFEGKRNGLSRAIEVFTGKDYVGIVELKNCYRGRLASDAEEM